MEKMKRLMSPSLASLSTSLRAARYCLRPIVLPLAPLKGIYKVYPFISVSRISKILVETIWLSSSGLELGPAASLTIEQNEA